jgi:hypothetical protein
VHFALGDCRAAEKSGNSPPCEDDNNAGVLLSGISEVSRGSLISMSEIHDLSFALLLLYASQ